jgi:hypothetical protein
VLNGVDPADIGKSAIALIHGFREYACSFRAVTESVDFFVVPPAALTGSLAAFAEAHSTMRALARAIDALPALGRFAITTGAEIAEIDSSLIMWRYDLGKEIATLERLSAPPALIDALSSIDLCLSEVLG